MARASSAARSAPIGVFDSGVGGLSVWREIVRQLPRENTLYVADQAHVPYGGRSLSEVRGFAEGITRFLLDQGAKIIVVACNTASAAALHSLRRNFPDVPFVGMEPALKPAVEATRSGVVAVMATEATFQGELFASLLERFAHDAKVMTRVCPGLVDAAEGGALDAPDTVALLRRYLSPLLEAKADQLVLGCTHYPFLRPAIEDIVGEWASVVDRAPAVACQTRRVLARRGLAAAREGGGRHRFFTSGNQAGFRTMVNRLVEGPDRGRRIEHALWQEACLQT